jgi:HK97 family phage prohead protease
MTKQYIQVQLKKSNDGKISFIASDETLDRSGEVIPIDSWDLENYKKNPVLLVNHDYRVENIVGKAKNIRREKGKLIFDPVFHDITQLAREVKEMVEQEILNTVSVGFMPHGPQKDGERSTNELFEISFVPVPANPSAERLNAIMDKSIEMIKDVNKKEIEEWVIKEEKDVGENKENKSPKCRMDGESKKECMSRKIEEMMKEDPNMDQDQAIAIASKYCDVPCDEKGEPKKDVTETEEKEGRVLSGKNRKLINDAVSTLKTATAALTDLLEATETANAGEAGVNKKGREPKVVYVRTEKEETLPSPVIRALQDVNRLTNDYLRKFKK